LTVMVMQPKFPINLADTAESVRSYNISSSAG